MSKPNILLITSDQQHFNTIGAFNPEIKTPNLDRLVREGTTFNRSYCPNPTCTPTRASIITGLYPSQHGAWSLGTKLSEDVRTVGEEFINAGYHTALVGKAHFQPLASTSEYPSIEAYPVLQDLDFWKTFNDNHDSWYGFEHCELARNHTDEAHVGQHYALWLEENGCDNWKDYFRKPTGNLDVQLVRNWEIPERYHYNNWITERTNCLLEGYVKNDEPFLMWASYFDPHPAYAVPEPYFSMYDPEKLTLPTVTPGEHDKNAKHFQLTQLENPDFSAYMESGQGIHGMESHLYDESCLRKQMAVYYGMVTMLDKYIGKILDKLDSLGIADNTIVVFTTDHGHFIGQHGLSAKGPFHYEDMIKIPLIVRYPDQVEAGKTSSAMQSLVDLAPTFLSFSGLDIPMAMTGKDQKEVWLGKIDKVRDHILCENHHEPTVIHLKTYVDQRYKITVYYNSIQGELFDLQEDPGEINNLWDDPNFRDLKMDLLLKYIWAEMGKEPMWMPRISVA